MTDDIVHRIITANAGRDPERLARKFTAMRSSPFTFLRGTAHLYFDAWPMNGALDSAPLAWCCGDLHLENFGTYRGDNRLTYFDLNDFDEAALAPTTCDVTRLLTSLDVAAESLKIAPEVKELETRFLDAYYATLADGRPRWVERATAKGMIRDLIRGLKRRKRRELLEHRTNRRGGGRRRLVVDGTYALPCSDEQRALVERLLKQYTATYHMPDFFEPIDVARRVAGTGSLGIERYVVLVEGRGSPNGNFLLDIKRAQPSVLASRLPIPATPWQTVAERVVDVERRAQAASPALFSAVGDANASYVLRELQPREDRLHLEHANGNRKQLGIVMTAMGVLTASAHMRTGGWRGAAIADEWIAFGSAQTLRDDIVAHAAEAANVTRADWAAFAKAYDDGAFAAK